MLKLYFVKVMSAYSGGGIVVRAESPEEAAKLAHPHGWDMRVLFDHPDHWDDDDRVDVIPMIVEIPLEGEKGVIDGAGCFG